jgi:outer membrane receptor for ferrienterochelin and colicins
MSKKAPAAKPVRPSGRQLLATVFTLATLGAPGLAGAKQDAPEGQPPKPGEPPASPPLSEPPAPAPDRPAARTPQDEQEERLLEELDLQTLLNTPVDVWTPSKTPQKRYEAPSIITTVTREQIAVWGFRSLAEILNQLLGFYVVDDHTLPHVVVRGTSGGLYSDSSIIKVLIDGHPVSFASTGGNWLGPELIPISAIDRIEVIRGPVSALYGANAFLALINIRTRPGAAIAGATGTLALGRVGSHAATDIDVAGGISRGMVEAMVAFRHTDQNLSGLELPASSPAPNIPRYNRGATKATGQDQATTAAIATLTLRPTATRSMGAFAYYSSFNRGSEFGSLFQLAHGYDERNAFSENRASVWQVHTGIHWSDELTKTLRLNLRASYFQGNTRDDNRLEIGSEYQYVRRRLGFLGGDLDAHLDWTILPELSMAVGANLMLDQERLPSRIAIAKRALEGANAGEVISAASNYQGRKLFINTGAYLHATWQLYDGRLGFTGGLRYDHHNVYGGQLSRRVGIVGSPLPNLHAKLLHGSAFQAPSPFLLHAVPAAAGDVVGNPDLRPQYVNTFEAEIAYDPIDALQLSTGLAYNLIDDKTEFIQQGINKVARNVLQTSSLSWESKAELKVSDWLNAHVSYELARVDLRSGQEGYVGQVIGSESGIYPEMMLHAGVAVQHGSVPARAAVRASYIGERRSSGNNSFLNGGPYRLPPYVILDANITTQGFRIFRHPDQEVSFSISGKNLLGAKGPAPGFSGVDFPLSPRAFFFQLNLSM